MEHFDQIPSAFLKDPERRSRISAALSLLRDAWDAAQDVQGSPWHFAVKREEFRAVGVADAYLLWLLARGYAAHGGCPAVALIGRGCGESPIRRGSRFVLSDRGRLFAAELLDAMPARPRLAEGLKKDEAEGSLRPRWDARLRRLCWNGILVKHFKVPAGSQELILAAFEEEGWPPHIDDPLPPSNNLDPKVRLRYCIKSLNRNQRNELLRFEGDGYTRGVVWRLLKGEAPPSLDCTRIAP
jgi:hypothetical protein